MRAGETHVVRPPHLPPREAWKVNPDTLEKFYAPTDDRGFVLPDATMEVILSLFDDSYEWPVDNRLQAAMPDAHHFHWTKEKYSARYFSGSLVPSLWRESPTEQGIIPRQIHNVLHNVTYEPEMPQFHHMESNLLAVMLAKKLFRSAEVVAQIQNKFRTIEDLDEEANQLLIHRFDAQFKGYRDDVEAIVESDGLESLQLKIDKFERRCPKELARVIGRTSITKIINYVPMLSTRQLKVA